MFSRKKILIVEDNLINRTVLLGIISSQYQVLEAENGQEALLVLKEHFEEISLILLDINMPVMNGYEFLAAMKENQAYSSIPVIVTTQSDSESDEVEALSHGAMDFVVKPYKPQIILHRIAGIIKLRETAAIINQFKHDRLTGLYSKEFFYQSVNDILQLHPAKEYDIICSDIEKFKLINDIFGIPAGDRLLCGLAELFEQLAADGHGLCGRLNADKFACLLERGSDYSDDFFWQFSQKIHALPGAKNVVLKWGVYPIADRTVSVEQMCDRALLAAHSIKGKYGKFFACYDDELRGKLLREQAITDRMESALAQGEFELYLQPKYRIADKTLAGAEALVRWKHPEWGMQSPAEFIPLFEKNGFITKLDQFVWEKACAYLRDWEEKGYPAIPISVNVSRADIYNADLAEILQACIKKYGLPASRLHLEITESAYTEDPDQIIDTVSRLRSLGFIVEMDDFGSGYSSLNMLTQMPIDILKLDLGFIQSETAKPVEQGILRFIIGLARWMNLRVVAEGVETPEQLEHLDKIGCDYAQGYYFSPPIPREQFETRMKKTLIAVEPERPLAEAEEQVILVADEDAAYRNEMRKAFEGKYQVVEAETSDSALSRLTEHAKKMAAIVLSLTLPNKMDRTVLSILQQEKMVWHIPIIATGPADKELEAYAFRTGADDYAAKPHLPSSLAKRLRHAVEISELRNREHTLLDEAHRDFLTGLMNRRGLKAVTETVKETDVPLALYIFDLDNLKQINDTFGHIEGDSLIRQFGSLLRAHTRDTDFLSRYGGDEFIVIMKKMRSKDAALKKGVDICRAICNIHITESLSAACSAGIAFWDGKEPVHTIIKRADQALYQAKQANKGGCCLWNDDLTIF